MPDPTPPGDDWQLDDVDWGEPSSESSSVPPAGETPARQRSGLIPQAGGGAGDQSASAGLHPDIRRRRIAALAALALLLGAAIVIPLVTLGGNGDSAEETTTPLTTAPAATTPTTTPETTPSQTTTTPATTTPSSALHVTLPAGESLRRGDSGAAVTQLQKGLVALGFSAGQPDGNFGAATETAVIDFQQSNDLTPDGVVGTDTVRLLNSALAKKAEAG